MDSLTVKEIGEKVGWNYPTARRYLSRADVRVVLGASEGRAPKFPLACLPLVTVIARREQGGMLTPGTSAALMRIVQKLLKGNFTPSDACFFDIARDVLIEQGRLDNHVGQQ